MDNVRFLYFMPAGYLKGFSDSGHLGMVFEICPKLSKYLREHSKCPPHMLCEILNEDNHYYFTFALKQDRNDSKRVLQFIEKVEQIGNEGDDEYLLKHIISDNGRIWVPGNFRDLITTKYDVKGDDMWNIYLFFKKLGDLRLSIWND